MTPPLSWSACLSIDIHRLHKSRSKHATHRYVVTRLNDAANSTRPHLRFLTPLEEHFGQPRRLLVIKVRPNGLFVAVFSSGYLSFPEPVVGRLEDVFERTWETFAVLFDFG